MRVCIIGSGLSALTLAKALVNQNIFVDIVSLTENYKIDESRTIGISKSNFEYFNHNIVKIDKIIWKLNKIEIYSDNLKNEKLLNFENKNDQLFSIVKNFEIYEKINKSLFKNKFFKKIKSKKNPDIDQYDLTVITDYKSPLAKKFFNKKIIKKYNSEAYTTIIHHEKISNEVATQIFTKKGPIAFLPISKNKTSVVYSIHNQKNKENIDVNKLIHQYNIKYKIKKIDKINFFDLNFFLLRSYYHKNILAFGDLLHRIHPLAGQGFNMTIRDIRILSDIIETKTKIGLPLDSSVNHEFENKMKHKNFIFSNSIDFIHEFFNLERQFQNSFLSKSVKFLGKNTTINKILTKIADEGIRL